MPLFFGKAGDASGIVRPFTVDAASRRELEHALGALGLFPIEVDQVSRGVFSSAFWSTLIGGRVPNRALIGFTRSLAILIESGIPILEALSTVTERELSPYAREVFVSVARQVEAGQDLHEALGAHPDVFPAHYVHSVQAGEKSASLDTVLDKLAADLEMQLDMHGQLSHAMIYPAVLALATAGLFAVSSIFVLPRFVEFYQNMGIEPPGFTSSLLGLIDFICQHLLLILLLIVLVGYRLVTFARTERGRAAIEGLFLSIPLVGEQMRAYRLGAVARNLALMKEAGMPLSEALELLAKGEPSPQTGRSLELARRYLEYGNSPSLAFEGARLMDAESIRMVRAGEETDRLGVAFRRIAAENERLVVRLSERIAALVPPILLVVAGLVVVTMVGATLIPMVEMLKNI